MRVKSIFMGLALALMFQQGTGQARTLREGFMDEFGAFLTLAGADYGAGVRQRLPLVMKRLNDVMVHPAMEAERPHVFTAQTAVFLRWLGQTRGAEERMELAKYINIKSDQLLAYAMATPQETADWSGVVVLVLKAAQRTFPGGGFEGNIAKAQALATGPGALAKSRSLQILLKDDGRLALMDDTLWLDLADAFAGAALRGVPRSSEGPQIGLKPSGVEEAIRPLIPKDHVLVDRSPGAEDSAEPFRDDLLPGSESLHEEPPTEVKRVEVPAANPISPVPSDTSPPDHFREAPAAPGPTESGEGGLFTINEIGIKITAQGWLRDAQALPGSVTLVQNNKRFTVQPEEVQDPRAHMENTIQGLRRVGFDINENRFLEDGSGYDLVVAKGILSQFVKLKRVGSKWMLLTATLPGAEFSVQRPILEAISDSIQPL